MRQQGGSGICRVLPFWQRPALPICPFLPAGQQLQAFARKKSKRRPPRPPPLPSPSPSLSPTLKRGGEGRRGACAELATQTASYSRPVAERAGKRLVRLGPRPTARYIIGTDYTVRYKNKAGVVVEQLAQLPAEERQHRDLQVKRWDLTETV